jgi:glutathione synthase/RimK-type ligase-like ATP-grasp enzyme
MDTVRTLRRTDAAYGNTAFLGAVPIWKSHHQKTAILSSRDVHFEFSEKFRDGGYIIQEMLDIKEEFRVYAVGGIIESVISSRTPKSPTQKVKVKGLRSIINEEKAFAHHVIEKFQGFDLLGLDIARTDKGLKLLEINRSCQFAKYVHLGGPNPAEKLVRILSEAS